MDIAIGILRIMLINSADDLFIHFHAESCEQSFQFQVKVLPINMSCWKNNLFRLKFTKKMCNYNGEYVRNRKKVLLKTIKR